MSRLSLDDIDQFEDHEESFPFGASFQLDGVSHPSIKDLRPRMERSLGLLTKNFLDLVARSPDSCIDLNDAAKALNIAKRRIYDITNVLEGINLVEKCSKSKICWKGDTLDMPEGDPGSVECLEMEMRWLENELRFVNSKIAFMRESMIQTNQLPSFQKECFLLPTDLSQIPELKESNIFTVRGPSDASFCIPDIETLSDHQILINSTEGNLDVCMSDTATLSEHASEPKRKDAGVVDTNGQPVVSDSMNLIPPICETVKEQETAAGEDLDLGEIRALCQEEAHTKSHT